MSFFERLLETFLSELNAIIVSCLAVLLDVGFSTFEGSVNSISRLVAAEDILSDIAEALREMLTYKLKSIVVNFLEVRGFVDISTRQLIPNIGKGIVNSLSYCIVGLVNDLTVAANYLLVLTLNHRSNSSIQKGKSVLVFEVALMVEGLGKLFSEPIEDVV